MNERGERRERTRDVRELADDVACWEVLLYKERGVPER